MTYEIILRMKFFAVTVCNTTQQTFCNGKKAVHIDWQPNFWTWQLEQSEKFLDLGTVTWPPSSIYARVNCSVIRDWCTRVQGHPRNLFRRPWNFGLSSQKHHTWPYHASVLWYTEANLSFQMQQRNFPRPFLRNDTMDFLFKTMEI